MARSVEGDLRIWIRDHHVRWTASAHRERAHESLQPVGYDLTLTARADATCDPGGSAAFALYEGLRQLAEAITPSDVAAALVPEPFEPAFHLRPRAGWQPEIELILGVRHASGDYLAPTDDGERACLDRVERALRDLGAQPL